MKTFITGSKDLTDYFFIQKKLKKYDISEIVIIQGIGTSSLAHRYAESHKIKLTILLFNI